MASLTVDSAIVHAAPAEGEAMHALLGELFPLPRSITGAGVRQTIARLNQLVPLTTTEVPTGTQVYVPKSGTVVRAAADGTPRPPGPWDG